MSRILRNYRGNMGNGCAIDLVPSFDPLDKTVADRGTTGMAHKMLLLDNPKNFTGKSQF